MFIQRARILKTVLKNKGCILEYSFPPIPKTQNKIRLGLIKDNFKAGTETYASLPVFEKLDHNIFDIFLYTFQYDNSYIERYCQNNADHFIVLPQDLKNQAQIIRNDHLDILFFATNLTASQNKKTTNLALHQLARVQVTSICSPVTTGIETIDYYLAGNLTAPLPEYQSQYSEKLINIEGSGICFHLPVSHEISNMCKTRNDLNISDETIVFISGSNFHKIIPEVRNTWAEIIANTTNSVLILYPFNPVNWGGYHSAKAFVLDMKRIFAKYGVHDSRLIIEKPLPDIADVRSLLRLADIYLDTFPYTGATSLLDPLSVGLPPVVYEGHTLRFRQGSAMLREIQLSDLVVIDKNNYIQLAVDLANNQNKREHYRHRIVSQMNSNPQFLNVNAYAQQITNVFKTMIGKH